MVLDVENERIDALDLDPYHADVPGLVADARDPSHLGVAGIGNPHCEAVLALTSDDEANLAVTMTAALLRPELPVIARTVSPGIAERMHAFGTPTVVNPFDRFGDHLRIALRAPASFQLMMWLEGGPGAELPPRSSPPRRGRWVVCGYGRLGRELIEDLHAEGLECTVVDPAAELPPVKEVTTVVAGRGYEPTVLEQAGVAEAVGFVAATDNDTTNLSLIAAARRVNPSLFVAARQNRPSSSPLFAVMDVDSLLVPTEVVAHEVYAQLSTPLLWRFLQEVPGRGNRWAADVIDRLTEVCGRHLGTMWKLRLNRTEAPALAGWLAAGDARLGDLVRDPDERAVRLDAVVLMIHRPDECLLTPDDDVVLAPDDELLLAGRPSARRALDTTLWVDAVREYVVTGRHVPASWIWRQMSRATRNGGE